MPKQLYYIGRFPEDNKPTAAIVGAQIAVPMEGYRHFGTGNFTAKRGTGDQRYGSRNRYGGT